MKETNPFIVTRTQKYRVNANSYDDVRHAVCNRIVYDNIKPHIDYYQIDDEQQRESAPTPQKTPYDKPEPDFGAYLVDKDGNLYLSPVDMGDEEPLGIAVIHPLHKFVMSLDQWREKFSNEEKIYNKTYTEAEALASDIDALDTFNIYQAQKDEEGMTAAKRCWEYNFGGQQWRLPHPLELSIIYAYRDKINYILESVGAPKLPDDDWMWSSAEASAYGAWGVNFGSGFIFSGYLKYTSNVVRAVAAFPLDQ